MRTWIVVAMAACGLVLSACPKDEKTKDEAPKVEPKKEEPKAEPPKVEPKKEEPKKEEGKTEEKKEEAKGEGSPEENCGKMYDFTKQLAEAFAKKGGKVAKDMPDRDKFVNACKELPADVTRCMNPQIAMKEAVKCGEVMKNADKEKIMKFKAMLK